MSIKTEIKYIGVLIKAKINKKIQRIYVPPEQKNVLVRSFSEIYAIDYFNEVALEVNNSTSKDKKLLQKIIKYIVGRNKKLYLIEKVRVLNDDDIKCIESKKNIFLEQLYIDTSKGIAKNQNMLIDIITYKIIIEKLEYFEKECLKYCSTEFEKVIFSIVSLAGYIKYVNTLESNIINPCLVNAFILRNGVCMDYAVALWKCLDRLNIECKVIKGVAQDKKIDNISSAIMFNHAWNQVKIDDKWYNVDLTWFSTNKNIEYVLIDDEKFYNNTHKTMFEKNNCKYGYNKEEVKNKVIEFSKHKNVFKCYDEKKNGKL